MGYSSPPPSYQSTEGRSAFKDESHRTTPIARACVQWDYIGENNDLRMNKGQVVCVTRRLDSDWWEGYIEGDSMYGMFPALYVEVLPDIAPPPPPRRASTLKREGDYQKDKSTHPSMRDRYDNEAGTSTTPSPRSTINSIRSVIQERLNPGDPFNPLPPSFLRSIHAPCSPAFEPIIIFSTMTDDLSTGLMHQASQFPFQNPPSIPTHDVDAADWNRLMEDMDISTRLAPSQRVISNVAPMALGMRFFPGLLMMKVIEDKMKVGKTSAAFALLERWNSQFFKPRGLDVFIAQGSTRLSGPWTTRTSRFASFPGAGTGAPSVPVQLEYPPLRNNRGLLGDGGLIGNAVSLFGDSGGQMGLRDHLGRKATEKSERKSMKQMSKALKKGRVMPSQMGMGSQAGYGRHVGYSEPFGNNFIDPSHVRAMKAFRLHIECL